MSMQTTGLAEFLRLRQLGYPSGTRGFPSHDCSWFGFIGIICVNSNPIMSNYGAMRMPLSELIDFQREVLIAEVRREIKSDVFRRE